MNGIFSSCVRRCIVLVIILFVGQSFIKASSSIDYTQIKKDILQKVSSSRVSENEKMKLYVDLFDIENNYDAGKVFLDKSLDIAIKQNDNQYIFEILDIHCKYNSNEIQLNHYLNIAQKCLKDEYKDYYITWLKAYSIVNRLDNAATADNGTKELEKYNRNEIDINDEYAALQREMVIASSMECVSYFLPELGRYKERVAHLKSVHDRTKRLPFFVGYKYSWYYLTRLEYIYRSIDKPQLSIKCLKDLENLYLQQFRMDFYKNRKYMTTRGLASSLNGVYSEMLYFGKYLGKNEIERIYAEMVKFFNDKRLSHNTDYFKNSTFLYYENTGRYDEALKLINEMISETDSTKLNKKTELLADKINLITLSKKNYEEGFNTFWEYNTLMNRFNSEQTNDKLIEMQTKYNLDKEKIEKMQMQARYNLIALVTIVSLAIVFLIVIIVQYILVVRLKATKRQLIISNEKVARESEKARAGENAKTEFIRSICHEIRTPLNAVCGFSRLMTSPDSTNEEKEAFPSIIDNNAKALTSLLDDILFVADLGSSSDTISYEECDVNMMISNLVDKYKVCAKENLNYVVDIKQPFPLIYTNSRYLNILMKNVLDNSKKFTNSGYIKISGKVENDKLKLIIEDTGIGIPSDKVDYIFERFTKLDSFTIGTGLGLYICKTITERLQGYIYVDTSYTQGARMIIELPVGRAAGCHNQKLNKKILC